jgi:hypothetical protein
MQVSDQPHAAAALHPVKESLLLIGYNLSRLWEGQDVLPLLGMIIIVNVSAAFFVGFLWHFQFLNPLHRR